MMNGTYLSKNSSNAMLNFLCCDSKAILLLQVLLRLWVKLTLLHPGVLLTAGSLCSVRQQGTEEKEE
jgi:hypothetical protein